MLATGAHRRLLAQVDRLIRKDRVLSPGRWVGCGRAGAAGNGPAIGNSEGEGKRWEKEGLGELRWALAGAGLGEGRRLRGQVGSCPQTWRACCIYLSSKRLDLKSETASENHQRPWTSEQETPAQSPLPPRGVVLPPTQAKSLVHQAQPFLPVCGSGSPRLEAGEREEALLIYFFLEKFSWLKDNFLKIVFIKSVLLIWGV